MNVAEDDEDRPLAWTAVLADTPVQAADGTSVGTVEEVLGSRVDDIFHGIVVRVNSEAHEVLIPADQVLSITNRVVTVALDPERVRSLPTYQHAESFHHGFTGILGRLGWVREGEGDK